jgi:Dolichyl-phosphate-mannose-protein mannosyltransferase
MTTPETIPLKRPPVDPSHVAASGRLGMPHLALALVLAVFIALATLIAFKTPAYESADEPGHVENIETLVSGHWYRIPATCPDQETNVFISLHCAGTEPQQAPLYYLLFAGWQEAVGLPAQRPYQGQHNPGRFFGSAQVFVHKSTAVPHALLWLRLPNVVLGALTILFTFFAVRLITTDDWTPVVAASLVAFLPRFVFLSAFVTNDNLVDLLGAVLAWVALRFVLRPSRWRIVVVGTVVGLLAITKLSTLPLAFVLIVVVGLQPGWRRRIELFAMGSAASLIISGWYFIQNAVRYGDPLARKASEKYLSKVAGLGTFLGEPYKVSDPLRLVFIQVPQRIVASFWFQAGWNTFHWSWQVNVLFCAAAALALVGLYHREIHPLILATLGAISVGALLSVWFVSFQTGTYEGRYAFAGISALAALAALGLERWKLPFRLLLPAIGLCGTVVALQLDVLAYHWT